MHHLLGYLHIITKIRTHPFVSVPRHPDHRGDNDCEGRRAARKEVLCEGIVVLGDIMCYPNHI